MSHGDVALRDPEGLFLDGGPTPNVDGLNQFSPEVILKRRLHKAIDAAIEADPQCMQTHALEFILALKRPREPANLALIKTYLPKDALVELHVPGTQAAEASSDRWSRLADEYDLRRRKREAITLEPEPQR